MAQRLQFAPQFHVVVNFAVEHNGDIAVVRKNRLVAATQVNNLESRRAHRAHARLKHSLLVRPTMNQRGGCVLNAIGIRHPTFMGETDDSTQSCIPRLLSKSADKLPQTGWRKAAPRRIRNTAQTAVYTGRNVILTVFFSLYKLDAGIDVQANMQVRYPNPGPYQLRSSSIRFPGEQSISFISQALHRLHFRR